MPAADDRVRKNSGPPTSDMVSCMVWHGLSERGVIAASGPQRGEGDTAEPAGLWALPGGVGDRDPSSIAVVDATSRSDRAPDTCRTCFHAEAEL